MSFATELKRGVNNLERQTLRTWRLSVSEAFVSTIAKTPKDTGAAANSWFTTIGIRGVSGSRPPNVSGSDSVIDATSTVSTSMLGDVVLMFNNLPYIGLLENGSSQQAPNGMVKTTVAEWPQIVLRNSLAQQV